MPHPASMASSGHVCHKGFPSMPTDLSASKVGVKGNIFTRSGRNEGKLEVGKKVPEKNIIGITMMFPRPEAAAGLRDHPPMEKPMLRKTKFARMIIGNNHTILPTMWASNTKIPVARMMTVCTKERSMWVRMTDAK